MADEHHHHTVATTYLADPDRRRVLGAKAVIAAGTALAFCVVVFAVNVPVTVIGATARDLPMTFDVAVAVGLVARTVVAMVVLAILGVALGAIVPNRTVVLVGALLWLAMLENIVGSVMKIPEFLPGALAQGLITDGGGPHELAAAPAGALLLVFTVAVVGVAAWRVGADVD